MSGHREKKVVTDKTGLQNLRMLRALYILLFTSFAAAFISYPVHKMHRSESNKRKHLKSFKSMTKLDTSTVQEQRLYTAITSATLSDDKKVLHFEPNHHELESIYIRPSWPPLYERIKLNLHEHKKDHILVTGTPGVGTTMFSYYYMWRAITEEKCTSFLSQIKPRVAGLHSAASVTIIEDTSTHEGPIGLPFFVDMTKEEPDPDAVRLFAYTIIFSSPDKQFMTHRNSVQYILEPWTEEEIYEAWRLVPSFNEVSEGVVGAQCDIYGGIPRSVFCHWRNGDGPMRRALGLRGSEAAKLPKFISDNGDDEMMMLLHMRIRPNTSNPQSLTDFAQHAPASPSVRDQLSGIAANDKLRPIGSTNVYN